MWEWSQYQRLGIGNRILFEKNSTEWTQIGFRYSAEESAHSDFAEEPTPKLETEFHGKKFVLQNSQNNKMICPYLKSRLF